MTHRPADPVVSGRPYVVLAVGDHPARSREDFVGPVELTLALEDDARSARVVDRFLSDLEQHSGAQAAGQHSGAQAAGLHSGAPAAGTPGAS